MVIRIFGSTYSLSGANHSRADKDSPMTATQTDLPLPHLVLSAMYLKFLADVDEYDNDEHRTVTASPDGPLVAMSEEALWFFNQWTTLKYSAYPYISDWDTVVELVLHSPEPLV